MSKVIESSSRDSVRRGRIPFWIRRILRDSSTYPELRLARRAARRAGRQADWSFIIGWIAGRHEGRVAAHQDSLQILLRERFGTVPPEVEAKVLATTDVAKLEAALLRVLHISAPDELPL
jgi:hypothetical protein